MIVSLRVVAPRSSGRAVKDASLFDSGRGNLFTRIVCAYAKVLLTLLVLILPRLIGSEVCCAIYGTIFTSLLCLDREALPLELSASLLARGLTARFDSRHSLFGAQVCFREKLSSLAFSTHSPLNFPQKSTPVIGGASIIIQLK